MQFVWHQTTVSLDLLVKMASKTVTRSILQILSTRFWIFLILPARSWISQILPARFWIFQILLAKTWILKFCQQDLEFSTFSPRFRIFQILQARFWIFQILPDSCKSGNFQDIYRYGKIFWKTEQELRKAGSTSTNFVYQKTRLESTPTV